MRIEFRASGNTDGLTQIMPVIGNLSALGFPFTARTAVTNVPVPSISIAVYGTRAELQAGMGKVAQAVRPVSGNLEISTEVIDGSETSYDTTEDVPFQEDSDEERTWRTLWRAYTEPYKAILVLLSTERLKGRESMSGYEVARLGGYDPPKKITGVFSSDGFARRKNGHLGENWKAYAQSNSNYSVTEESARRFMRYHRADLAY